MENEFSLEDEEPLQLTCDEGVFDIEGELENMSGQHARELRLLIAFSCEQNYLLTQELERLQNRQQREQIDLFVSFAKEYFELQKTIKAIQTQGIDCQFSDHFDRLIDTVVRLEEIFRENGVEVEDAMGQPINPEIYDVCGTVELEGTEAGLVVEAYSPVVRYAERVIHRAKVMVSR